MRHISGIIAGVMAAAMVAGCATTTPTGPPLRVLTDAEIAQCRAEAEATTTGAFTKVLIWASNIVVIPVTTGLTLGTYPVVVYPRADSERRPYVYQACMDRLSYQK